MTGPKQRKIKHIILELEEIAEDCDYANIVEGNIGEQIDSAITFLKRIVSLEGDY